MRHAPRIYCIPATGAPVVAVFRRGPTNWAHVGRWDLHANRYEPGAWLAGRLFPRRCDLSPDGRLLCYFAHQPGTAWQQGDTYVAVSKLPWLTALYAVGTCGTWTRGYYFAEDALAQSAGREQLPIPWPLRPIPVVQFANERRRGWREAADCPQRDPRDAWDEHRAARLEKRQPGGHRLLRVESLGAYGHSEGEQAVGGLRVGYWIEDDGDLRSLDELQWADWDRAGNLLAATRGGELQVRRIRRDGEDLLFREDLSHLEPAPVAAPSWARSW